MILAVLIAISLSGGLRDAPCDHVRWERSTRDRERLIVCLSRRYDIPGGAEKALDVARCESGPGLDPRARYAGHVGMWQHRHELWPARAEKYLWRWHPDPRNADPENALWATLVTFQMVADDDIGWQPWSCA